MSSECSTPRSSCFWRDCCFFCFSKACFLSLMRRASLIYRPSPGPRLIPWRRLRLSWSPPCGVVALGAALRADVVLGEVLQCGFVYKPTVGYFGRGQLPLAHKSKSPIVPKDGWNYTFLCSAAIHPPVSVLDYLYKDWNQ